MPSSIFPKILTITYNLDFNKYFSYLCSTEIVNTTYNFFQSSDVIRKKFCVLVKEPIQSACDNVTEPLYNKLIIWLNRGLVTTITCENIDNNDKAYSLTASSLDNQVVYQDHCPPGWTSWINNVISYTMNNYIYPNYASTSSYTANITQFIEENILSPLYQNCLNMDLEQAVATGASSERKVMDKSSHGYPDIVDISVMVGSILCGTAVIGIVVKKLYNKYSAKECNIVNTYDVESSFSGPHYSEIENRLIDAFGSVPEVEQVFLGSMPTTSREVQFNVDDSPLAEFPASRGVVENIEHSIVIYGGAGEGPSRASNIKLRAEVELYKKVIGALINTIDYQNNNESPSSSDSLLGADHSTIE